MTVVTRLTPPQPNAAQKRIEAIVRAAADLGMSGMALAKLRSVATSQIEPLVVALRPFADFADEVERFVDDRARDNGSAIMPTNNFRLADFKRAKAIIG